MARPQVVWHGTKEESLDLVNAVAHNCGCEFGFMGIRLSTCPPHKLLAEDQRWLDAVLFERRDVGRLLEEEWAS